MKQNLKSCVRKNTAAHYVTCNECELHKTCTHEMNNGFFGRLYESILVWWYRTRTRIRLSKIYRGITHRQAKSFRYAARKAKKSAQDK